MNPFPLSRSFRPRRILAAAALLPLIAQPAAATNYEQQNLVTDDQANLIASGYRPAAHVDPNLVNPWGISMSATSPFWVSNAGTGVSTLYNSAGIASALVVSVPGGDPTGQVFNGGTNFRGDRFIFATEAGKISGWKAACGTNALLAVDNAGSASYKGLAIDTGATRLYAANFFGSGGIEVFDSAFNPDPAFAGKFTDPTLPAGYAPFNIQNLAGSLYVAYAFKTSPSDGDETTGAGLGLVDVFDSQGNFVKRLIGDGATGPLNAPWGMAIAPSTFGALSNSLLVGNFGDGKINAFNPTTGDFIGALTDLDGKPIVIDGLWGLTFGNGGNGGRRDTLYFAAGINDENHGLFGSLSVPEPGTVTLSLLGLGLIRLARRHAI